MRVAIYQYQNYSGDCPSCNQAVVSLVRIAREACQEKARELFGEDCEFVIYFDRSGTRLTGESIHNLTKRPRLQDLLGDIEQGKVDVVVMSFMADLSVEEEFIIDFYRFLKKHQVKLVTVREGFQIMEMLDKVLELSDEKEEETE